MDFEAATRASVRLFRDHLFQQRTLIDGLANTGADRAAQNTRSSRWNIVSAYWSERREIRLGRLDSTFPQQASLVQLVHIGS
ncbi:hypothetical protein [Paraburkholderia hospita]|uniref:hypothetical protein n=1 Tax=Paraburkholderia hospita TaxID=169430 RepID=UPI0009A85133|nr:hypothetical protein [Paraburkholderia hospita]